MNLPQIYKFFDENHKGLLDPIKEVIAMHGNDQVFDQIKTRFGATGIHALLQVGYWGYWLENLDKSMWKYMFSAGSPVTVLTDYFITNMKEKFGIEFESNIFTIIHLAAWCEMVKVATSTLSYKAGQILVEPFLDETNEVWGHVARVNKDDGEQAKWCSADELLQLWKGLSLEHDENKIVRQIGANGLKRINEIESYYASQDVLDLIKLINLFYVNATFDGGPWGAAGFATGIMIGLRNILYGTVLSKTRDELLDIFDQENKKFYDKCIKLLEGGK